MNTAESFLPDVVRTVDRFPADMLDFVKADVFRRAREEESADGYVYVSCAFSVPWKSGINDYRYALLWYNKDVYGTFKKAQRKQIETYAEHPGESATVDLIRFYDDIWADVNPEDIIGDIKVETQRRRASDDLPACDFL